MSKTQTTKPSCLSEPTGRVEEVSILVPGLQCDDDDEDEEEEEKEEEKEKINRDDDLTFFLTVHRSIDLFQITNLMHNSFIL
jgi:hypothetical protein